MHPANTCFALSFVVAILVALTSYYGISTPGFYSSESLNWQAQSVGQDMVDLFLIVPVLVGSAILSYRNYQRAMLVWTGTMLYLVYTYVIFCFDVHFNSLFPVYCVILGLTFYLLIWFIYHQSKNMTAEFSSKTPVKTTGIYFLFVSSVFYFLWLSEIMPSALSGTTPAILVETGLITNPVHVLDLAIILPGIFITGLWVLKKKQAGLLLAPAVLTFFVLMDITIAALMVIMKTKGLESNEYLVIVMISLAIFSIILLARIFQTTKYTVSQS